MKLSGQKVKQIQQGLNDFAELTKEKKNNIPFHITSNIAMWIEETRIPIKTMREAHELAVEELGEKIYAKETIVGESVVKNYDEAGEEKLAYWKTIVSPENQKKFDDKMKEIDEHDYEFDDKKVKPFIKSQLKKLPLSSFILYSLFPIIQNDIDEPDEE